MQLDGTVFCISVGCVSMEFNIIPHRNQVRCIKCDTIWEYDYLISVAKRLPALKENKLSQAGTYNWH